jgi:hypothetical protein
MSRFTPAAGRHSRARLTRARRPRSFGASLEAIEERTLMSTLGALSWKSGGVQHTEVFGLGVGNVPYVNKDGTGFVSLGGYATQISAGTDAAGNPEVYAIGGGNALYVNDNGKGWTDLGGTVTAISATADNTVFAIGGGNAVYINRGTGFVSLGGYATQISAGTAAGNPEVYAIGGDRAAHVNDNGAGWVSLGGYVTELGATANGTVFARGSDVDAVYVSQATSPFKSVGSIPLGDPASGASYSPAPASAPLFNGNQPSYLDVEQGAAADCWLLASLAEVAARAPQDIKNMFVYDGTTTDNGSTVGLYSVRFFSTRGEAFSIQVDTDLPAGGQYYDHVANALGTESLWVALAEKGYAEANALGLVTTNSAGVGSYASLNYGDPAWALQAITGNPASDYSINPTNIVSAWNSGQLVVLTTSTPTSSYIVASHCYALVNYNASSGQPFEVFNPWGTQASGWAPGDTNTIYGLFTANAAFLSQNFAGQSFGTGAIDAEIINEPIDPLTQSVTASDGHAPTSLPGFDLWAASDTGDGDNPTTSSPRPWRIGGA